MKKSKKKLYILIALIVVLALLAITERSAEPAPVVDEPLILVETPVEAEPMVTEPPAEEAEPEETEAPAAETEPEETAAPLLDEHGTYDSKEDVALFIHLYGRLPDNYMSKKDAEKLGWEGGSLERYAPGMCIGGSRFGNYEELLPEAKGRTYIECDIDTLGESSRGAKRIVFSNDGLIYYTDDHYESFELLYGEP